MLSEREQVPDTTVDNLNSTSSPYLSAIAAHHSTHLYQDTALSTPFRTGSVGPSFSFSCDGISFARIMHSAVTLENSEE